MSDKKKVLREAPTWLNVSIVGIQFPVAIGIGYWWGSTLDRWFGTKPYLTAIFSLFGIIAGFINLFRIVAWAEKQEQREAQLQSEQQQAPEDDDGDRT